MAQSSRSETMRVRHSPTMLLILLGLGCARAAFVGVPPSAETVSLLGDTLWSVPVPVPEGRFRVQRLHDARDQVARTPGQLQAALELARATVDLGRLREAIRLYTEAAALGPADPRPFLGRGELHLRLREFDRALSDLRLADRLGGGQRLALVDPRPDGGVRVRSVAFAIPYYLGFLHLLRGDAEAARANLAAAASQADEAEDAARAAFWYAIASPGSDFERVKAVLPAEHQSTPAHPLLVLLQRPERIGDSNGGDGATSCRPGRPRSEFDATRCYLVGRQYLARNRTDEARMAFAHVRRLPDWSVDVALAAEAALSRLERGSTH